MRSIGIIIVFLTFNLQPLIAQTNWFSIDTNKFTEDQGLRQVINIVNEQTNELAVFFRYRTFIVAHIYDETGNTVNTFKVQTLPKYHHNYFGASFIKDKIYTLFFKSDFGTKFSALTINFNTSSFQYSDKLNMPLKSEKIVGSFEYKSKTHLLTTVKKTSKLKIYQLNDFKNFTVETFDFSNTKFVTYRGFDSNLNEILKGPNADPSASMVNHGEPTPLETVTPHNKVYLNKDKLIITNDIDDLHTRVISINLETKEQAYHKFPKPSYDKKDRGSKSNSYVLDHLLFNMYISKEKLDFSVFDMDTKDLVKNIVLSDKDSIAFKNSPIILEGGDFQSYRELDRTKQFMRKVTNSNPGISVYKNNGKYVVTVGSSETTTTSPFMVYYAGGAIGGLVAGITSSVLTTSFLTYTKTKSTRIECLFDNQLNSIEGSIPENNFNIINAYTESKSDTKFNFESILKINKKYVLGYFDENTMEYKYLNF
ncbi:hypothetical protein KO504_10590 [Winogradskyella psychrotolerans]|uniref:hypothetical protein n=1 Tax=Winogradskyella psychrotolerans TaxID=1344585 RepID=UPI001C065F6B|nr:hypothetical protein [Winogradskyella psychrotolerans]MBU2921788.1 hypothetical protein [Winogradskyella psychrotolerans]